MNRKKVAFAVGIGLMFSLLSSQSAPAVTTVARVTDGDTVTLTTGEKVRLLQIDTPELSSSECFGFEARNVLIGLLSGPGSVTLKSDPKLDQVDRYGRLLRYIFVGKTNINLKMVEMGAAAPYFYRGERGQYSNQILKAAQNAKSKSLGLWKSCPGTQLTPTSAITTVIKAPPKTAQSAVGTTKCDSNYAGCVPVSAVDLDCKDIKNLGLAPVKVIGRDVHNFDRDGDGIGCDK
jgi:endonuclease YncB( thermonuclease family)